MKTRAAVVLVAALLVSTTVIEVGAKKTELEVVFNRNGNALVLFGGDKGDSPDLSAFRVSGGGEMKSVTVSMSDYDAESYGNGFVRTEFDSDVEYGSIPLILVWREVDGESETFRAGTSPQYNSSKIALDESWRFYGTWISVSIPGGVSFSGSGSTIRWSGSNYSGDHWWMGHTYSGLHAESYVFMSNVRQSSFGSHDFSSTSWWVSTMATDSS